MNNYALTLIKFWAPWCNPCKTMKTVIEKTLVDFKDIELIDINIDEDPDTAIEYRVRTIPTLILKQGDEIVHTLVGTASPAQVKEFLSKRI